MTESGPASKEFAALFALIRHHHPDVAPELLASLPEEDANAQATLQPGALTASLSDVMESIHYSWLAYLLKGEGAEMQPLWCAALPLSMAGSVADLLGVDEPYPSLPDVISLFLMRTLYQRIGLAGVLPESMLPESPLNALLTLDKRTLVRVIDYLGLYDLAASLRLVVLPALRQRVEDLLTSGQRLQLSRALQSQDLLPEPEIELDKWTENTTQLNRFLQIQGLARLGKALGHADPSLTWHLSHRLDTGRGKLLLAYAQERIDPELAKRLGDQIDSLVHRFTEES